MKAGIVSGERAKFLAQRKLLDPFRPQGWLVESERNPEGVIVPVATLFLTNRECPWRCLYCDLWKHTTTETVPPGAIPAQIDYALAQLWSEGFHESPSDRSGTRATRPSNGARQIKLYNAGSFFDPKAIPPDDFPAIAEHVSRFERVVVEAHPALVGESAVRFRDLLTRYAPRTTLEVAMGLEIADDAILEKLNKRMTLAMFGRAAEFLVSHGIAMRVFVIVKPPFVRTDEDGYDHARRSIDFAFDCGADVVSLIPARFGMEELEALAKAGDFAPPKIDTLEAALDYGVGLRRGRVFADLWDVEKLGCCCSCLPDRMARLREMNLTQTVSPQITCAHGAGSCASGI